MRKFLRNITIVMFAAFTICFSVAQPVLAEGAPFNGGNPFYIHQETSSVIGANSMQLGGAPDQIEDNNTSVKPRTSLSEFQWWPGIANRNTSGITNGYSWNYDTVLEGKFDSGSPWSIRVRVELTGGGAPAAGTIRAYIFRTDGVGSYTALGTASLAGVGPGAATTYTLPITPGTDWDMQGEYLYVHFTWQTTDATGANNPTKIAFNIEGTDIAPATDQPRIIAGASSISTLGYLLLTLAVAFFVWVMVKKRVLHVGRATA